MRESSKCENLAMFAHLTIFKAFYVLQMAQLSAFIVISFDEEPR